MYVQEIVNVKHTLQRLHEKGLIAAWELPYEHLLTRLSAAIFFVEPADAGGLEEVWDKLGEYPEFSYRLNEEKRLSKLSYRITFNIEK